MEDDILRLFDAPSSLRAQSMALVVSCVARIRWPRFSTLEDGNDNRLKNMLVRSFVAMAFMVLGGWHMLRSLFVFFLFVCALPPKGQRLSNEREQPNTGPEDFCKSPVTAIHNTKCKLFSESQGNIEV
jgi:hypothetical protein